MSFPPDFLPNLRTAEAADSETTQLPQPEAEQMTRPRSLRMQYRFLRALIFAFWLLGRLIFWQIYVRRWFPGRVERGNNQRWIKYAREFRAFAVGMGGVMIKLGQFFATRFDVLPEEVIRELLSLVDEVPAIPFDKIRPIIESELGPIDKRYRRINETTVAAASLGQVHRAQLLNGDRVVVKVQRPEIRDIVHTDLAAMMVVARFGMRFAFIRNRADAVALTEEFGRVLLEEVSYIKEAQNGARFAKMFKDDPGVYVPAMYPAHSTDSVLTMEDVTAIKITDYAAMEAAGINRSAVARRLMDTYLKQVFEERFFHADPHPGNLFVYPLPVSNSASGEDGQPFYLIFVDFGMAGELTEEIRQGVTNTLLAVVTRDAEKLVHSYEELGFLLPGADTRRIVQAAKAVFDQVWGMNMSQISDVDYDEMLELGREFSDLLFDMPFRIPQDLIYLGRTLAILSGMATTLDPSFNAWDELQPFTQKLAAESVKALNLGEMLIEPLLQSIPRNREEGVQLAQKLIVRVIDSLRSWQQAVTQLEQITSGELEVVSKPGPAHRRQLDRIEAQGRRTTRAVLFGCALITSTLFYTNGDTGLAAVGYVISGLLFLMLVSTRSRFI